MLQRRDLPTLFVYYKLPLSSEAQWPENVTLVHHRLCADWPGLQARLMRRHDERRSDGHTTWMEVFEHPEGVGPELQKLVIDAMSGLDALRSGGLHVECFTPVAPDKETRRSEPPCV